MTKADPPAVAPSSAMPAEWRSSYGFSAKARRVAWMFARTFLFRPSFHNWYAWRRLLLRAFGAKIGQGVRVRPSANIEMPWNLDLADGVVIGDYAILYSLGKITIGERTVVSQYAHLCAGTHDYRDPKFPLLTPPITVGAGAWIAADAFISPGVAIGDRTVVAARATVVKDVPPDQVVGGNPAKFIKMR
jgi:putative colanic acid biosynthesis acetyltransferase WcaF